jgi:AraC-like DNA-binding protein
MQIELPAYFHHDPVYRTLALPTATLAAYRREQDSRDTPVHLSETLLLLVLSGRKIVRRAGAPDLVVEAGQGAFIRKGQYLMSSVRGAAGEAYESVLFSLPEEPLRAFMQQYRAHFSAPAAPAGAPPADSLSFALTPALRGYVASLLPLFDAPPPTPLLQLKLQELLLHFVLGPEAGRYQSFLLQVQHAARFELRLLMEQNFQRPFSLAEFAFLAGRSLSSFKRDFQVAFGQPPAQWLRAQRLEHARFLLRTTGQSVGQVADEVGFASASHFVQAFRERFGVTPGQAAELRPA